MMRDLSYYFCLIIVPIQTISEKLLTYITKVFTVLANHFIPTLLFHKLRSSLLSFENIYEKYSNQDLSYWLIGVNTSNLIKANHTVILKNWCFKCFKSILFRRYSRSWKDSEGSKYNRDQYDDNDWRGYESKYPQSNDYEQDESRRYHLYDDYYQDDDGRDLGGEGDNQHWQDDYQNHRGDEGYRSYHDQSQYSNSCPQTKYRDRSIAGRSESQENRPTVHRSNLDESRSDAEQDRSRSKLEPEKPKSKLVQPSKLNMIDSESLREFVRSRLDDERAHSTRSRSDILLREPTTCYWKIGEKFDKQMIIRECVKYTPHMNRHGDAICMDKFLNATLDRKVYYIGDDINDYFVEGAPLLEYLSVYQEAMDAWKYPTREEISDFRRNRGLSLRMISEITVREIVVGSTSAPEILDIVSWFWVVWKKDQERYPSNVVSMDNEELPMTLYDIYRITGVIPCVQPRIKATDPEDDIRPEVSSEDRLMQFPVKVMLGNGFSWALMISVNLERDTRDRYLVKTIKMQPEIIDFIETIPVCIGLGVKGDVADLAYYYSMFVDRDVKVRGFVDLTALSVLCGYEFQSRSMTPMAAQVCGLLMNKMVSTADSKWAYPWNEIPESLRIYALADLQFGYMTYTILTGIIIADLCPDPEIVCYQLQVYQLEAVQWLLDWILQTLENLEVHQDAVYNATTRRELICALRYRYNSSSRLSSDPPPRINIWLELLGDWPSLTAGGCRFIVQPREHFMRQVTILRKARISWGSGIELREVTEEMLLYARFSFSVSRLRRIDWNVAVSKDAPAGLTVHPGLALPKGVDPMAKYSGFLQYSKQVGRVMKFVLLHWARTYPGEITSFLKNVRSNQFFRRFYQNCYDAIRFLYRRIFNIHAMRVCIVEEKLTGDLLEQLKVAKAEKAVAVEEMKIRDERVVYLQRMVDSQDSVERARWREYYPELPSQARKRERRRARSQSRGRSQSRSKSRRIDPGSTPSSVVSNEPAVIADPAPVVDLAPIGCSAPIVDPFASESEVEDSDKNEVTGAAEIKSGGSTSDPKPDMGLDTENGSVMMEVVEVDEEMFLEDFTLPIPKARKIVPDKRKSKGRKKKPGKVLTDAQKLAASVETETRSREEDVDLEFEFSESL